MSNALNIAGIQVEPGQKISTMLKVTRTLRGDLYIPVSIVNGKTPGPKFAILCNVHGDEAMPFLAAANLFNTLDPQEMSGSLIILPVSNPLAFSDFRRESAEQRENTDLHRCFPGNSKGSTTEMIAYVISQQVLNHVDALCDMHSGGQGGRIHQRTDLNEDAVGEVLESSLNLCKSFGTKVVHANNLPPSTAVGYLNSLGKPASGVEIGGTYMSGAMTDEFVSRIIKGLKNQMRHLKILSGEVEVPHEQFLFTRKERKEANPTQGGYILSHANKIEDLERVVKKGEKLGEVIDPYTLKVSETLEAPCEGILFFSRMSGPAEAGAKGYAIADLSGVKKL